MNLVSGYPFWLIKDGLPFNYPALERSVKTDVVIIGAGISGALMGYYLVNAGVDCVIVDSRTIGLGSTCASTSLLQYEIDTPLSVLKRKIGLENAVCAYKLCEAAIDKIGEIDKEIGCGEFEFKRSLYYATGKKYLSFLAKEFSIRKENNFNVTYLEAEDINRIFGFTAPAAILSAKAAQTNAYKFTHALHQSSQQKGLQVYDRTAIVAIDHQKDCSLLKTGSGFTIRTGKIIYATGYEAVNYIEKKIVELHATYATISEQYPEHITFRNADTLIWNTDDPYLYMRTTKDRRIIVGGRDETFKNAVKRDKLIQSKSIHLKEDFEKLFPGTEFKPEFSWTGTFGSTKDGLPFIGTFKNRPHSYFALGFGGNGITFSLIAAGILTELLTKGKSQYSNLFSFDRV